MTVTAYQTTYSTAPVKGLPGQIANAEISNIISRTVESSAGIEFGQPAFRGTGDHGVVVGTTQAGTGTGSAQASGNVGTGTITASPAVAAGAKQGRYKLVLTATSATAPWIMEDPTGVIVGEGNVATAATVDGIGPFTISNAGTMTAGDTYYIDVAFTSDKTFVGLAKLNPAVPGDATTPDRYPQYFTGAFMTQGQMYVTAGASVADGDDVYWNPATKRYTNTTTHVRIPRATFDTTGADGDIVEISLKNR